MLNEEMFFSLIRKGWFSRLFETIKSENRYNIPEHFTKDLREKICDHREYCTSKLESGTLIYRTRLQPFHFMKWQSYSRDEMLAPPQHLAIAGRMNPQGIPYLYASKDEKTAIAELRPWVGAKLALATLKLTRDLNIFNSIYTHCQDIKNTEFEAFLQSIDELLSTPIYSEDTVSYTPSQFLAEFIKINQYDGIAYKSSLSENGINIALFNPFDVKVVDLHTVNVIKTEYEYKRELAESEIMRMLSER